MSSMWLGYYFVRRDPSVPWKLAERRRARSLRKARRRYSREVSR